MIHLLLFQPMLSTVHVNTILNIFASSLGPVPDAMYRERGCQKWYRGVHGNAPG